MSTHDEIRAALEAATPGPWHAWDRGIGFEVHEGAAHLESAQRGEWCQELNSEFRETFREPDARLIAKAPEWLAELLAENEQLAQSNEDLRLIANVNGDWNVKFMHEHVVTRAAIARAEAAEQENERLKSQVAKLRSKHHDGCAWCCASTPPLRRGEGHKICSAP